MNQTKKKSGHFQRKHLAAKEYGVKSEGLIDYYGTGGDAMDNAWFGKLTANVDADNKKLTFKAPNKFIKDLVQSNYTHLIDKLCSLHSYSLEEVVVV